MINIHECTLQPNWGEVDAFGHINNVVYFRYFEEARIRWFKAMDWCISDPHETGPVVLQATCTYLKSIHYPVTLIVKTALSSVGNTSFTVEQQLVDQASGELYTEASFKCVWVNQQSGKPAKVLEFLRRECEFEVVT